ncbi:SprT-like domain-containing protein [Arcanobacterium bovis]|uniref:SprT domain-containing protein n=1 Tax=Arcanobacterium bovis TaxID=2529275 RepID=A0A4Q9V0R4_9ACTO|nr:SprT-like domain-containing protein [Arcanobacterium bovis]TBW21075.1 sprT domain-containing protein [Arcanobacterium bovis]
MDLTSVETLARGLMHRHGLGSWALVFDRAKRRAGMANFTKKQISLSSALMELYSEQEVRSVILHEIAHVLAGPDHGHDAHWARICTQIGGVPRARIRNAPAVQPLWIGVCPHGHTVERHRRPRSVQSCARCSRSFSPHFALVWTNQRNGEVLRPHGKILLTY